MGKAYGRGGGVWPTVWAARNAHDTAARAQTKLAAPAKATPPSRQGPQPTRHTTRLWHATFWGKGKGRAGCTSLGFPRWRFPLGAKPHRAPPQPPENKEVGFER